ncbi:MAG: aldehyde dehydrogenase family protein [Verrucomicrobia bacterium]|nr:aldehyde dehydrogenase family protein [Verrucomicrobiota bacterium]
MALRLHTSFINGKRLVNSGRIVKRRNPGQLNQEVSRYRETSEESAEMAMGSGANAFAAWSDKPLTHRVKILESVLASLDARSEKIATLITRENGKTLPESRAEVAAGIADSRFHLKDALRSSKQRIRSAVPDTRAHLQHEPVGVFLLITPWNFPLATILRKLVPALVFGNTVVVKPSEYTSATASVLFDILASQKLPAGVANLVLGSGPVLGPALIKHDALRGISFTGSTENGLLIANSVAGRDVRLQLEMGGKNSLLVLADADIDSAVDSAVVGAFSCAGQWCTGTGRVIVEDSIYDDFCQRLIKRAEQIVVGPGHIPSTRMGPLISSGRLKSARQAVRTAIHEGAKLACGGKKPRLRSGWDGHYLAPTIITEVNESMTVFADELFAPVLPVVRARDFEDGLRLANRGTLGLSASIFTEDRTKANEFLKKVEAGIAHVNLHTAFRVPDLPISGWRDSGRGIPECGRFGRDFYTRPRSVYLKT